MSEHPTVCGAVVEPGFLCCLPKGHTGKHAWSQRTADERTYTQVELDKRIAQERLAEAEEWAAHRPGDGFYDRRIKELRECIANLQAVGKE